jgi:uncharacterized membrane-anchored protein
VHSAHRDHWQLGRLVTTLLEAGTTRIAAMFGLGQVEKSNEQLREVETELREIAIAMPDAFNSEHWNDENGRGNGASIVERLIDATAKLATASGLVTNGLSRRTERSRYYIAQFERAVENLAVTRIEGFQPYNTFVQLKC